MLTDVQKYSLKLLLEINDICNKHDIVYYLAGGSVIGALRHRGFIPWDDDIDLYMTGDNWRKFREAFSKEKPANRTLESSDINVNYPNTIAKYTSSDTTAVYRNMLTDKFNAGVIIDILIIDALPAGEEIRQKQLDALMLYSEFVNPSYVFTHRFGSSKDYAKALAREEKIGHEAMVRELEAQVTKYSDDQADAWLIRWGGIPHIFPREMFGKPRYVPFEGVMLPVPKHSYLYLAQLYGEDWTQIPSHSDQIVHQAIFSIKQPSKVFYKDFRKVAKFGKNKKAGLAHKLNRLEAAPSLQAVTDRVTYCEATKLAENLKRLDREHDLKALYEAGRYTELREYFDEYLSQHCTTRLMGNKFFGGYRRYLNPSYGDIGDDLLAIAIELLQREGRLYHALRLLTAREKRYGALSDELSSMREDLQKQVDAADAVEQGDLERARLLAEEGAKKRPDWINFIKLRIEIADLLGNRDDEFVAEMAERLKEINPGCGDWMKYEADSLMSTDPGKAMNLYCSLDGMTNDGWVLLRAQDAIRAFEQDLNDRAEELVAADRIDEALEVYAPWEEQLPEIDNRASQLKAVYGKDPVMLAERYASLFRLGYSDDGGFDATAQDLKELLPKMGLTHDLVNPALEAWACFCEHRRVDEATSWQLMDTDAPFAIALLGDVSYAAGDYVSAFDCYRNCLKKVADNDVVRECLRKAYRENMKCLYIDLISARGDATKMGVVADEVNLVHQGKKSWSNTIKSLDLLDDADEAEDALPQENATIMYHTIIGMLNTMEEIDSE